MSASFVYVISGDHGRQKIGSSDNPRQRIKDLKTGSPYPLKFEFIGETNDRSAGAIEVEAQFMLSQHRAEGEWFVVPSDVAITAVMAAAHRLGYRCKPVDLDGIKASKFQVDMPAWQRWLALPLGAISAYYFIPMAISYDAGRIDSVTFIIGTLALIFGFKLAHWLLVQAVIRLRLIAFALAGFILVTYGQAAHAANLRPHERQFIEFEMTVISIANNCDGYQAIDGSLPKMAAEANVRPAVVEAVHEVLQVAAGNKTPYRNIGLMTEATPIIFDTLATVRDTLKKPGACDLLGTEAVTKGFLRRS